MSITTSRITELAPDQESLNAASKLIKPGTWPLRAKQGDLFWGECLGSGANPYRTVFDNSNAGYNCSCPSRKFPCKHVLALMWIFAEAHAPFIEAEVPLWVTQWQGRRRQSADSTDTNSNENKSGKAGKSLTQAQIAASAKPIDPAAEARRKAASESRTLATRQSIAGGLEELQQWLSDQLRGGLASFLNDPVSRCRTIAARLVDAKAQALASRLDELPSRIMLISAESRLDALLQELGRIILICRAWKANPADPELARLVGTSETRDSLLASTDAQRVSAVWEVVGEQITTRRDGLISQATWLLNLDAGNRFALLLDYFPASLGMRSSTMQIGDRFEGELVYYPARQPIRAVIAQRKSVEETQGIELKAWPAANRAPLETYHESLKKAPWLAEVPLLLPCGRVAESGSGWWWQAEDKSMALPIQGKPSKLTAGLLLQQSAGLWDGMSLNLLSSQTDWGRWSYAI
jgi:hypothetical protein